MSVLIPRRLLVGGVNELVQWLSSVASEARAGAATVPHVVSCMTADEWASHQEHLRPFSDLINQCDRWLHLTVEDRKQGGLTLAHLDEASSWILTALESVPEAAVFVHCHLGISRSPTVAMSVLLRRSLVAGERINPASSISSARASAAATSPPVFDAALSAVVQAVTTTLSCRPFIRPNDSYLYLLFQFGVSLVRHKTPAATPSLPTATAAEEEAELKKKVLETMQSVLRGFASNSEAGEMATWGEKD